MQKFFLNVVQKISRENYLRLSKNRQKSKLILFSYELMTLITMFTQSQNLSNFGNGFRQYRSYIDFDTSNRRILTEIIDGF